MHRFLNNDRMMWMPALLLLFCLSILSVNDSVAAETGAEKDGLAIHFRNYCVSCHNNETTEGDVNLFSQNSTALENDPQLTRLLIDVLDQQQMPPEEEEQPSADVRRGMLNQLQTILHTAVSQSDERIRTPIRRMNRFQYNNAVVDLFQLKCIVFTLPERAMRAHQDYFKPETEIMAETVTVGNRPLGKSQMIEPRLAGVAAFPQDLRAEHGYDNQADHLSLSPLLMEAFLNLGQSVTQSPDFNPKRVGIWKEFFAAPEGEVDLETEIRNRLRSFLTKAFRQAADEEILDRYTQFALHQHESGVEFTEAMKMVAAATISSPRFLYLYDKSQEGNEDNQFQSLDDYEIASRLSFFLWGSLPDEVLLKLAAEGQLKDPVVLEEQVDRMLKDRKLKRFCDSFPAQWLQLDRIISSVPNRDKYPDFYFSKYRASMHMMMEPLLLFETVLIENRPVTELIDPDFTYRSNKLEMVYGELGNKPEKPGGGVTVLNFKRVPVTDRRSGGVITNAAVMTMTSGPDRTQPITRGAWIAAVIFNDPPKPPPADVPPLSEKPQDGEENLTLRERLAAHRERSDCRGCHEKIDPLGFALENYNPVGKWRETYENGREVDASGRLFRQYSFDGAVEFKAAIMLEKDRFCRAFTSHLMSFALARELGPADQIAIDEIAKTVADDDYRFKTLIRQIVLSEPFRTKS